MAAIDVIGEEKLSFCEWLISWSEFSRSWFAGISTAELPGHALMHIACKHICSSLAVPARSSVISSSVFSCIRLDIINGWHFLRAWSVQLHRYFWCRNKILNSSVSASGSQQGEHLLLSSSDWIPWIFNQIENCNKRFQVFIVPSK